MLRIARRHLISIICFALAATIGLAAIADHRNKQDRINRAYVGEWYCAHQHVRCGGPSTNSIEAHWNQRQWMYQIVVVSLGGAAVALFAFHSFRSTPV